jgi:sugar (pentulose or hexulose) kinase
MFVLGLDIGTQGVRGIIAHKSGEVVVSLNTPFVSMNIATVEGHKEQDALVWWQAALHTIQTIVRDFRNIGHRVDEIAALAVDGTSGTIVPLDDQNIPLCRALLYNDARSTKETMLVREKGKELEDKLGYRFNSSYALPKMLWIKRNMPEIWRKTRIIAHQSDYIVGRLTGIYNVSDYSNALKSGYDLIDKKWPRFIEEDLEIPVDLLPRIVAPGTLIGNISPEGSEQTGLSVKTAVVAGATDGYASAIASGAIEPGDFNTTIGTTMVIKGVTPNLITDPKGRVYCHLYPDGYWMPGGASNVGGRCLNHRFHPSVFDRYNKDVPVWTPTGVIVYPLVGTGERFPFIKEDAKGFILGEYRDDRQLYAALMEGVAYTERLAYDTLEELGCKIGERIYVTGGAVKSREWSQLRANILNKTLLKPQVVEAAMGSAIIAASTTLYGNITDAARSMVKITEEIYPRPEKVDQYQSFYERFKKECRERGYIE